MASLQVHQSALRASSLWAAHNVLLSLAPQAVTLEQLLGVHLVANAIIGHLHPWKTVLAARATCRTFRRAIESYMKGAALPPTLA